MSPIYIPPVAHSPTRKHRKGLTDRKLHATRNGPNMTQTGFVKTDKHPASSRPAPETARGRTTNMRTEPARDAARSPPRRMSGPPEAPPPRCAPPPRPGQGAGTAPGHPPGTQKRYADTLAIGLRIQKYKITTERTSPRTEKQILFVVKIIRKQKTGPRKGAGNHHTKRKNTPTARGPDHFPEYFRKT